MNTIYDLYDLIIEEYGKRGCWISDLAEKLGICNREANYLTCKMGYYRGRVLSVTSYSDFANDEGVQVIFKTLQCHY